MINDKLYDWGDEGQNQEKTNRSLFDNLGDALTAIGANFSDVRGSERLGDIRDSLRQDNLTGEEINQLKQQYYDEYAKREAARQQYAQAHQNLVDDDSFLKNIDQMGGTLEGMAAQGIGTAVGAGLGALATGGAGIGVGAKIGNAAGAVAGGYLDARSVALQAEEEVLDAGGTWEQAKQAYDEALKKASLTTLPETLADIAMGNRLVRAGLSSGVARKIAGSTLGRAGSAVLDPAARLGTKAAFASGKGLVGRGVGLATDIALQGATEAGQEVTQDYIANREVAKALGQQDNEYSLGGFKDFALSPQGLETMKTAGIMGALFGGVGGAVSSGQYLQRGAETNMGIKTHNATQSMVEDGNLKLDKQKRAEEEKVISLVKGISPAQLATWSDADIIAESSVIRGQYRSLYTGEDSDVAQVREAVDTTDRLSKTDNSTTREGDLTERSKTLLDRMGIDNREMFNSPAEKSVIEQAKKANEELQKQTNKNEEEQSVTTTEKKEGEPAIKANITVNTAADMAKDENGNITTNENDIITATYRTQEVSDKSKTDGVVKGFSASFTGEDIGGFKNNDVQGMNYVNSHEYSNESIGVDILASEIMGNVQLKNMETGKIKPFNSPEEAKQYLVDNQNNKEAFAFQEERQQFTEEQLPENGVDVETSGHTGQLIQSVDDLYNLAVEHPELVNAYDLMEFIRMKQHMGVEGFDIYLNREKYGYHKDPKTGKYIKVHGYAEKAKGKARAFIQLYRSGDLASAVHEIAHIGYWNLNESDKRTFDYYAIKTQGRYIADMLDENYDDNFVNRLIKLVNDVKENKLDEEDKQLQNKINSHPATRQIQANLIPFYNSVVYNEVININNLTKEQQIAIQERWAWEMSQWYIEGYVKGVEPKNIVERIEQRGCASIAPELNALLRVWEHIHHKDSGIENIYRGEQAVDNKQEETTSQPIENIQFTNELQRQTIPNINMPMSFGGEQTVQYNVPTLGEGYDMAKLRADTYNDALNKQWNLYRTNNLPSADGSVATNQRNLIPMGESQNRNIVAPEETNSIDYGMRNGTFRIGNDLQANPLPVNSMQFNNENDLGETVAGTSFAQKLTLPAENGTVEKNEGGQVNGQTEDTRRGEDLSRTNGQQRPDGRDVRQEPLQGRDDGQNVARTQERVGDSEQGVLKTFGRKILGRIPQALKKAWKGLGCNSNIEDWRIVTDSDEFAKLFSDALVKSIKSNTKHGVYVSPMSVEELKGATIVLHKSKKAGLAIKDGTLHGVFKDPSLAIPKVIRDITLIARELGCVRMDCYGDFLVQGYQTLGYVPVAKLTFTDAYIQDEIKANPEAYETILEEKPPVYVLVRNNDSNEVARNKIANKEYKYLTKKELSELPTFDDYDGAISYGDSAEQIKQKVGDKYSNYAVVSGTEYAREYFDEIKGEPKSVLDQIVKDINKKLRATTDAYAYSYLVELKKNLQNVENSNNQKLSKQEVSSRVERINKQIDKEVRPELEEYSAEDIEHSKRLEKTAKEIVKMDEAAKKQQQQQKQKTEQKKTEEKQTPITKTEYVGKLSDLTEEETNELEQQAEKELSTKTETEERNSSGQIIPHPFKSKKEAKDYFRRKLKEKFPQGEQKRETPQQKPTKQKTESDNIVNKWIEKLTEGGEFNLNDALTSLFEQLDKGNITQKEYDQISNAIMEYAENQEDSGKDFMFGAISEQEEKQREIEFRKAAKTAGFTEQFIEDFFNASNKRQNQIIWDKELREKGNKLKSFLEFIDEYNQKNANGGDDVIRNLDGRWAIEFDDSQSSIIPAIAKENFINTVINKGKTSPIRMGGVFKHAELYSRYPDFKKIDVVFANKDNFKDQFTKGEFRPNENAIYINLEYFKQFVDKKNWNKGIRETFLHEIQHAIQYKEGFAFGNESSNAIDMFMDDTLNRVCKYLSSNKISNNPQASQNIGTGLVNALKEYDKQIASLKHNNPMTERELSLIENCPITLLKNYVLGTTTNNNANTETEKAIVKAMDKIADFGSIVDQELYKEITKPLNNLVTSYYATYGEVQARRTGQRANLNMNERRKDVRLLNEDKLNQDDLLKDTSIYVNNGTPNLKTSEVKQNGTVVDSESKGNSDRKHETGRTSLANTKRTQDANGGRVQRDTRQAQGNSKVTELHTKRNDGLTSVQKDSGRVYQESSEQQLSKKARESQQILEQAFPDTVFQYAWHSTPHDFNKFTLEHLLSGEGFMAHGWGLYFAKSLIKNKRRYFDTFNRKKQRSLLLNGENYNEQLRDMYETAYGTQSARTIINDVIYGYRPIKEEIESIDAQIHNAKESLKKDKEYLKEMSGKNKKAFESIFGDDFDRTIKGIQWSIDNNKRIIDGLEKINEIFQNENFEVKETSANILLVNIPENDVLLREDAPFNKQSKYVQKQLLRMFEKTGRRKGIPKSFMNKIRNTTDIYGFVTDYFGSQEDASIILSEYGIKGISYRGEIDGECFVIFDDTAIDIINKFKKEEGKWVSQQKKDAQQKKLEQHLTQKAREIEDLLGIQFQEADNKKKPKPLTDAQIEAMDKREEAEYNKRKERVEKADNAGELSDIVKDVYSVTFTKSAQNFAENRTRMEYFDNRDKYWNRSEKDGNVTYTRKTPLEHHKKVITYNGANELMQEDKKKSKPAQWAEWFKDQLIKYAFNDMHFLAKAARKLGKYDAYVKMIVTKGYALKANTAMQRGIKYNGKYTRALNDIIKEIGEEKQKDFIEYCIAKRVIDLSKRDIPVYQDMKPDEAADLIKKYESGADAKLFMKNQKDFVEYNKALLHVLVDGGIHTEEEFQKLIEVDPNFVPLSKVMDDADMGFNSIQAARSIVNVKTPLKRIGTSFRKVKNPFLEMQKRTAEYYAIASRNKAGQIFVNEIANALDKKANGDTIAKGQGMIRQVSVDEKDGNLITKPDDKQQIIYVCNNGKHEFYQVSDPEIYRALKALDADQMGTIQKMIDPFLHAPSALIRETATMVPDFGVRNLLRDGGEAFLTSEHGFLPFIDQIWGMYQMANNTEWYQRFLEQKGEYGTYNRENANDGVARIEDTIDEKVNPIKNFNEIRNAALQKLTNKKNSKATRAVALLQLMGSMPYAVIKSNKRLNDYLEMGTRIGEFKNAKMGYNGTLDRLSRGGILDWNADINKARQDDVLAAGAAKEITLNFEQYGIVGKQLNRYIPFFNATLQGIYKMCNALELMATGTTLSGQKNRTLQGELLFKAALITAIGVGVAAAGEGDDDYEEANQYEKENFWILPNGLRFPKDQVLGKLFGNVAEKSYTQWRKGKFEPSDILRSIKENFTPDKFIPALAEIALGGMYNYDTFYKSAIVPEYMQGKLGHLQKDLATSNMASDVSDFLWKYTKTDVSAKRLDWALQKNLTNCKKYIDAIYDLGKQTYDPKSFNEKMARGYDKSDSTGAFVGGLKDDVPKPLSLVTGTFATNRTNYKSISDFYEKYNDLKRLATDEESMSKEDKRAWKRYEQAYKKDKNFRKQLRAIKSDSSLTGKQKREKADKIFKQQIKLAKWAEG